MLTFDNYSHRDLQHLMQLLNQLEAAGITDSRFVRKRLHDHLYRPQKIRPLRKKNTVHKQCASCGSGLMVGPYVVDNLKIVRCSLKCGYSEVVA